MTEMKAVFTSDFNTLKIRSMVLRLHFEYLQKKVIHCMLLFVSKWFPSTKTCLSCGYIHKEIALKDRTYICPLCGHVMDRDHQAAVNLREEALRIISKNIAQIKRIAA